MQHVPLHDQAQEEFTLARAVSPPGGVCAVVHGSPRGTGQEETQALLHPAADRGAQTAARRDTGLAEHHRESREGFGD